MITIQQNGEYEYCYVNDKQAIAELGSALTWEGLNIDIDNINKVFTWLNKYTPATKRIYIISGKDMNNWYGLTDSFSYPQDLNIVAIDLKDIDHIDSIVLKRFDVGARWLDDIIANNLMH
jgi:hypothetical protein